VAQGSARPNQSFPKETASRSPGPAEFEKLAQAVDKAIKAALIESHGSLPQQLDHAKLVSICESTGVWDILPPALKALVQEVESYQVSKTSTAAADTCSSSEQLQRCFFIARRLIDYMEFHVIGNDSVLKRLKVA
jgi:hypothetical protein